MSETAPEHKDLVRELYGTVYEQKRFDAVSEFYSPEAVRHGGLQGRLEGHKQLQGYLQASLGGLSDIEITELHCLAEDDTVAYDFEMAATHSGEMLEVPATGNRIEITNAALFRIADGRVTDEWPRTDMLGLLEGIGLVDLPF
jgi:predicted ester cyclase